MNHPYAQFNRIERAITVLNYELARTGRFRYAVEIIHDVTIYRSEVGVLGSRKKI